MWIFTLSPDEITKVTEEEIMVVLLNFTQQKNIFNVGIGQSVGYPREMGKVRTRVNLHDLRDAEELDSIQN